MIKGYLTKSQKNINPFVRNTTFETIKVLRASAYFAEEKIPKHSEVSANHEGGTKIKTGYLKDKLAPLKLYTNPQLRDVYMEMGAAARKLLDLIMFRLPDNSDQINIKVSEYSKIMKCSIRKVYTGIEELRESGFIVKDKGTQYWINPHYFFKGSRIFAYGDDYIEVKVIIDKSPNF